MRTRGITTGGLQAGTFSATRGELDRRMICLVQMCWHREAVTRRAATRHPVPASERTENYVIFQLV